VQVDAIFFIVNINLNHNVILYFLDLFSCINIENDNFFVVEDFMLVVNVFLGLVLRFFCFTFFIILGFFFFFFFFFLNC
jgi:hypothetical protein